MQVLFSSSIRPTSTKNFNCSHCLIMLDRLTILISTLLCRCMISTVLSAHGQHCWQLLDNLTAPHDSTSLHMTKQCWRVFSEMFSWFEVGLICNIGPQYFLHIIDAHSWLEYCVLNILSSNFLLF